VADRVGSEGSVRAPIVLIGEAPGKQEMEFGRPFCGPSYHDKLLPWWRSAGLQREDFFITNVLDFRPERIDGIGEHEMRRAMDAVHERLAAHEGPDGGGPIVIVPTGNYALYALTGKGRVSFHTKDGRWPRPGVSEWRGSILEYVDRRGRRMKVIPTLHPAMTFRTPTYTWVCAADWQRIAADATFRELRLPERKHTIAPHRHEVLEWIRWTRSEAAKLVTRGERMICSLDVETPNRIEYELRQKALDSATSKCQQCGHTKRWHGNAACNKKAPKKDGGTVCRCFAFTAPMGKTRRVKLTSEAYLGCIGYCWDPKAIEALCVPTTPQFWHEPAALAEILAAMAELHADTNIDFVGQNFLFDAWWCARERMPLHAQRWCTMKMHRVLRPWSEWNDLAFQASIDTREPFWKHEAKDPDSISRFEYGEALFDYNCTDNRVQRMLVSHHINALHVAGRLEYYNDIEAPIDDALLELSRAGIRTDCVGRAREYDRVTTEAKRVSAELNAAAGAPIVACNKSGTITGKVPSTAKLKWFLYEHLRLPPQYTKNAKKEKTVSTNIVSVRRLMDRFPGLSQLQDVGTKVLQLRRLTMVQNFMKEERLSADGRHYAFFRQDTGLGRLSSSKTLDGKGAGLQNIDRSIRKFYIADANE
jgi:DNA polymerase